MRSSIFAFLFGLASLLHCLAVDDNPCYNGGQLDLNAAVEDDTELKCKCDKERWSGPRCENIICHYGEPSPNGSRCDCKPGKTGRFCEFCLDLLETPPECGFDYKFVTTTKIAPPKSISMKTVLVFLAAIVVAFVSLVSVWAHRKPTKQTPEDDVILLVRGDEIDEDVIQQMKEGKLPFPLFHDIPHVERIHVSSDEGRLLEWYEGLVSILNVRRTILRKLSETLDSGISYLEFVETVKDSKRRLTNSKFDKQEHEKAFEEFSGSIALNVHKDLQNRQGAKVKMLQRECKTLRKRCGELEERKRMEFGFPQHPHSLRSSCISIPSIASSLTSVEMMTTTL